MLSSFFSSGLPPAKPAIITITTIAITIHFPFLVVSSALSFDAYADGYSLSYSVNALMANKKTQLDGTVAPGKKIKGVIGYEVPVEWKEIEARLYFGTSMAKSTCLSYTGFTYEGNNPSTI